MKREMKRVAGLPLPLYLAVLGLLFLALWRDVIPAGMPGGLFLLLVLGEGLNELGKSVPLVKTYFGGSVVCVLGGAALSALGLFPAGSMGLLDRFIQQEGFLIFYIAALITGSLFQIDRRLLFRASLRILPTALAGVAAGTAVVVLLGLLQGFRPAESLLYIAIPMTSGGMTAGAVPLSGIYAEATGIPAGEILTRIAPATVLGNIVSILFGALSVQLSRRFPKISGGGQLLRGETAEKSLETPRIDFSKLLAGLLLSLAFYMGGALLHGFVPALPAYAGMILCIMAAKGFSVLPEEMEEAAALWGQFVIRAFTAAALTGIGIVLLDLNRLAAVLTLPYLLTVVLGVLAITLTAGFVGSRLMGFYPLEVSIAAGMCTTNMGGSGNVAVLSAADRMALLPFAQIVTRSIGALMLTLGGILVGLLAG